MSRRHSTSPDSKPITTRLHKLTALLDELAKAPHQPGDSATEFLPTKLLKRVLSYVGSGGSAGATNQRWRRVAANPELWRDAVQRAAIRAESRETADGRARQQAKDVILALRAASRALAATPGSRIAELRDAMAAAARRQRRAPTDVERPVLEASCDVLGLNSATASHFRAALDGAPAAPGAKPRPRLGAALAALDVPALALSDDADAHRRLYELAVGFRRPEASSRRWERARAIKQQHNGVKVDEGRRERSCASMASRWSTKLNVTNRVEMARAERLDRRGDKTRERDTQTETRRNKNTTQVATADPAFPAPARAAKANVHLGRLAAWCVAAANCRDALLRARHTTPQPPRGPPAAAVVAAGERAVKRWLRLCAPGGASPEKPPEKPPQAMTTPSRFAQTRRRRRPAPSCPPPSTPSLRAIFDASRSKPVPRGADCAQTLRKFYAIHNPSLLPRAAQIAREWRGSEETLFALLRYKYGSGTSSKPLALALDAAETAKPRRRRSMSVVPAREGPRDRAEALRTLRAEVERLKALEEENAAKVEREKRRANYASQRAKSLKEERDDAIEKAAEVTTLRRESAKLRENESKRLVELERLQKALEREREASSQRTPASPSKPARDVLDPETVAVDAVLAALSDVLVAECATEVEFELEFGLSEAQLLGLAPLPELPSTVPEEPARPSLEEQIVAGRQNLRRARSASPPARRDASETPATLLRGWAREQAPSSGSSKASPTLRDLETTFRSLSSELSPSTAQGVLDGLESPLDGLVR